MLNADDIQFIKDNRTQLTKERTESVDLTRQSEDGEDPLTGDTTYSESTETVEGTWKTLISQSGGEGEIRYVSGVKIETDDVILNLDISVDMSDVTKIRRVSTGDEYVIKAKDTKGLGEPNRHYILLELVK